MLKWLVTLLSLTFISAADDPKTPESKAARYVEVDFARLPPEGGGTGKYSLMIKVLTEDPDLEYRVTTNQPLESGPANVCEVIALSMKHNRFKAEVVDGTNCGFTGASGTMRSSQ